MSLEDEFDCAAGDGFGVVFGLACGVPFGVTFGLALGVDDGGVVALSVLAAGQSADDTVALAAAEAVMAVE